MGYNFTKNTGFSQDELILNDVIPDNNFGNKNFFFGGGVTQFISDRISLKIIGQYGKNMIRYSDTGVVGYTDVKFKRLGLSALPCWKILDNIELGIGLTYHELNSFEIGKRRIDVWNELGNRYNQKQIGWITSVSYNFKSILINLRYTEAHSNGTSDYYFIKETNAIELSLAYRLKIFHPIKFNRKNAKCPKIEN